MMTETERAAAAAFKRQHPEGGKAMLAALGSAKTNGATAVLVHPEGLADLAVAIGDQALIGAQITATIDTSGDKPRVTKLGPVTVTGRKPPEAPPVHPRLAKLMAAPGKPKRAARPKPTVEADPIEPPTALDMAIARTPEAAEIAGAPDALLAVALLNTREAWMQRAIALLTPRFEAAGHTVPPVRISTGWPGGRGKKAGVVGQCFPSSMVEDGIAALFVSPVRTRPIDVLETVCHELVHATLPTGVSHRGPFARLAAAVGLAAPWTGTDWHPDSIPYAEGILSELGPLDHSLVKGGSGTQRVQTTRMLKVECSQCGCILRMTNKWIAEAGLPTCGCGGEMVTA